MGIFKSIAGTVHADLTGADTGETLFLLNKAGAEVFDVRKKDSLTVAFSIYTKDVNKVQRLAKRRGDSLRITGYSGIFWPLLGLLRRPVLLLGIVFILGLTAYLPTRILFVQVEGNSAVPTQQIIRQAESCGIRFGASRRAVRSERVKNALLEALPQLQWAGENTAGCVAVIQVRERTEAVTAPERYTVSSIVAQRDGVIHSCTVTQGNALCKVGQAVKEGQKLVSGYTDHGISITAERSEAEIFAQTQRQITVLMPEKYEQKGELIRTEQKFSIIFGKKQINFFSDSGISDATCVKMYSEYYVTLPGGFRLPVALAVEKREYYGPGSVTAVSAAAQTEAKQFAQRYLLEQMIGGQILSGGEVGSSTGDVYCLYGKYFCLEMIGREQNEEIIVDYGKSD